LISSSLKFIFVVEIFECGVKTVEVFISRFDFYGAVEVEIIMNFRSKLLIKDARPFSTVSLEKDNESRE